MGQKGIFMGHDRFFEVFYPKFEKFIVMALAISVMLAIAYATVLYFLILMRSIISVDALVALASVGKEGARIIEPIALLQTALYHVFGGFLLILLGIELISTIRSFSKDRHIKMESIVGIAIIATARHVITLDYHHVDPLVVFAVGFVILSLTIGYFLLRFQSHRQSQPAEE